MEIGRDVVAGPAWFRIKSVRECLVDGVFDGVMEERLSSSGIIRCGRWSSVIEYGRVLEDV